jgi:origin recognition complex subunit 4
MTSVLHSLMVDKSYYSNAITVYLNGLVHTDDSKALKSATAQLDLENAVDGKVFGSFAENLAFLLECLKAGDSRTSKSVIFILEEFDLFCTHHNQTLLYNLFDVAQSAQAPICVVGLTCRLDVMELFEKRVKSRFSHRQIFLHADANDFAGRVQLFRDQLSLFSKKEVLEFRKQHPKIPKEAHTNKELRFLFRNIFDPDQFPVSPKWVDGWNAHIDRLSADKKVLCALQTMYDYDALEATFKLFLFRLVARLDAVSHPAIETADIVAETEVYLVDDKILILNTLSVLEMCLIIAAKHHSQIYDRDPFNFEMLFTRFRKFSKTSTTMQNVEKRLALTAFEHIKVRLIFLDKPI